MADNYGNPTIPLPVPAAGETVTDSGLSRFGDFCKTILNTYGQTAWNAVAPPITGAATSAANGAIPLVRSVLTHNPEQIVFNEKDLPAIYLDRVSGERPYWYAEDYRNTEDRWRLLWVFRPSQQYTQVARNSFTNGIVKVLDRAIEDIRDPAWALASDTDPLAASVAALPSAIKTAVASSTSAQAYSGVALDGSIGSASFSPARQPTVTIAGSASSIVDGSTVTFTGIGADGSARTSVVVLVQSDVPGTFTGDWSLARVDSIDVDAQAGIAATLAFGLGAFAGIGSSMPTMCGLQRIEIASWRDLRVSVGVDSETKQYDALEISLTAIERLVRDLSLYDDNDSQASRYVRDDGSAIESAIYT